MIANYDQNSYQIKF